MEPSIFVINRAQDDARLARFAAGAAAFDLEFERVPAFDGHDPEAPFFLYRELIGVGFWGRDTIKPGAFGCAISHLAAWRKMLASDLDYALICEDDAVFIDAPHRLFTDARRKPEADVIFANARAAGWRASVDRKSDAKLIDAEEVISRMAAKGMTPGEDLAAAPGADCYLISRRGAERLIAALTEDRVIAGVDWLMLNRGLAGAAADWEELTFLAASSPDQTLQVFFARDAVADQRDEGQSALSHKTERPISELTAPPLAGSPTPKGDAMDPVIAAMDGGEFYETPALELMRRWAPEGGVFVDVGAHVGNHTLFMLRHGGAARAIPIEFSKPSADRLRELAAAHGLVDRIDDAHLGLGLAETRGKKEAAGSKKNLSNNRLREGFVESINVRPGDALLRESAVDMIKIDVVGAEREVLKGLKKTLKRKRPVLAIDLTRPRSEKALPLLGRLGYTERERAEWTDAEGDRRFAIFTAAPRAEPEK